MDGEPRQAQADGGPSDRQAETLDQEVPDHPAAGCADRQAQSQLAVASMGACEEQIHDVRAGDQEDEAHRAHEQEQGRSRVRHETCPQIVDRQLVSDGGVVSIGGRARGHGGIGLRLGLGLDARRPVGQEPDHAEQAELGARLAPDIAVLPIRVGRLPDVAVGQRAAARRQLQAKVARKDADHRVAVAVEPNHAPDDVRIGRQLVEPERVRDDGGARRIGVGGEPAEDGVDAQHGEEAR